jgi:hypothetical protein
MFKLSLWKQMVSGLNNGMLKVKLGKDRKSHVC